MNNKNFNFFFDLGSSKIRAGAFNKDDNSENFYVENQYNSYLNLKDFNFLDSPKIIEATVLDIEKKTGEYLNDINLMVDCPDLLTVSLSLSKNVNSKNLKKDEIKYIIQDAKQQILRAYSNYSIVHIIITNYKIDENNYDSLPLNTKCKKICIDIVFICFPKLFIKKVEELFLKCNISIKQILLSSYAKSLSYLKELSNFEKIAFIDIGFEKTSVVYFNKKNLIFIRILPIGGHHITKDISKICNVELEDAEKIKLNFDKDEQILNKYKLSLDLIKKIIFARIEEILDLSVEFFDSKEPSIKDLGPRLIIMGEGARILDNEYKDNIRFSSDIHLLDETTSNVCEAGLNLVQGINKQEVVIIPKKIEKKGFFERLFHFFK